MPSRQVALSTLWQLASQIAMAGLSIITVKFVTMALSKELVGNYNSAYGYLQLFGILADFGLYAVAVQEVARSEEKSETLGALIAIRFCILILSLSAALLFAWAIPMWRGTPLPLAITIAAFVPFFTLLAGILRTAFQVNYRMHYVFVMEVVQRIITAGAIGAFALMGTRGSNDVQLLHTFLFIGGIGAFILFCLSIVYGNTLIPIRLRINRKRILALLKKSAPYGIAFLCMALYRQFDLTLIALLRPDFELQNAYYGIVVRMADMGFLIPTFLLNSTLPLLSERLAKGHDAAVLLGKTFVLLLLLGSIAALFAFFWPRPLVQLLTTNAYLSTAAAPGSDTALKLLSAPLFLNGLILYGFYVLLSKHQWKKLVATLLLGAGVSLLCNFILIPTHGFVGVAYTSIVVHTLLGFLLLQQGLYATPVRIRSDWIARWIVFSLILAGSLAFVRPFLTSELTTIVGLLVMTLWMLFWGSALRLQMLLRT